MPFHEYPFESRYLTVDGVRIHYIDEGRGEPVLLLHGNPTWSYLYRKMVPPLVKAGLRAVAPDLMGFGLSDKPHDRRYTFSEHADIIAGFITQLGLKKLTLVGQDWGGPIGLDYAVKHKENIARLVLMNTFVEPPAGLPPLFRLLCRTPVLSDVVVRRLDRFRKGMLSRGTFTNLTKDVRREYLARHPDYASRIGVAKFLKLIPLSPRAEAYAPLRAIHDEMLQWKAPVLLLYADNDIAFGEETGQRLQRSLPNARLVIVEQAGHFLQEDRPDFLADAIIRFIAETGSVAAKAS